MSLKRSLLVLPAALLLFKFSAVAEDFDARLGAISGTVEVLAAPGTDSWSEAEEGMPLSAGDKVRSGEDASAEISLDDGGVIGVGENSTVKVSSLGRSSASFFLDMGSLVAKKHGLLKKKLERLEVRTPAAVAAVRGTEFCVEHDPTENETTAGVFDEGKLSVSAIDADGRLVAEGLVEQGNEVSLRAGAREVRPARMRRLLRRRTQILAMRGRLGALRQAWKRMSPEKRKELRERFMKRRAMRAARGGKAVDRNSARPQQPHSPQRLPQRQLPARRNFRNRR
jgi:hypothetical protein